MRASAAASAAAPPDAPPRRPLARLGVLADIQAADIADGAGFSGRPRYYRAAVEGAARAAAAWRDAGVDAVLHLGDIVDLNQPRETAPDVLDKVVTAIEIAGAPHYHVVGNHCLASLGRPLANARLGMGVGPAADAASYYSARLGPGWRLVALDGYDVSVSGRDEGHPHRDAAARLLAANNPNANKNSADGLVGLQRRFVAFGGGVGDAQLAWLEAELAAAAAAGDRVIVAVHQPLHPDTCPPVCLLWNYDAVMAVLSRHGPSVVAATLAGHAHRDGAAVCDGGIHHRVLGAVLEAAPGTDCYATLDLYADGLVVRGEGAMPSGEVWF
jgi:manganese-dependent ADP-ribose/CDP-alcohol diphosphatase